MSNAYPFPDPVSGKMWVDDDSGSPSPVEDDPYAELFADCTTVEEIMQLQAEIDAAEKSANQ